MTWALGHLVTLADPEEYDKKFEEWEEVVPDDVPGKCGIDSKSKAVSECEVPAVPKGCIGDYHCNGCRSGRRASCQMDPGESRFVTSRLRDCGYLR